jgi:hypothetical protein
VNATSAGQAANTASIASRPGDPVRGGVDEILPSARVAAPRAPDQIALQTGSYRPQRALAAPVRWADQLKSLGPTQTFALNDLKTSPQLTLGTTRVDMSRVLANPKSVANRGIALQNLPDSVRVNATSLVVTKVAGGLVVRSFVNYSLLPGTCAIAARRAKVEAAGARCSSLMTDAARDKAFSTPGDARYIADPTMRAAAIAQAKTRAAEEAAMLAKDVATLRADLKDPARRAELVAALGEAEVVRLTGLDDAGLTAEIVNSGETKMEDVSYIPVNDVAQTAKPAVKLGLTPPPAPAAISNQYDLGTNYFLAGFTLGREYEWRMRVEQRINRCLIGCAKTYFVEAFAGFNYGLGLRFPIELTGTATYVSAASGVTTASVTPKFRTLDGSPAQYLASGLPSYKLFDGQEFVAQLGAHAGFGFDLPFYPSMAVNYSLDFDFTKYLGGKFAGGNFAPPVPGEKLVENITIYDVDLLGGQANFGVVGAQVYPAANIILTSNELSMMLVDRNGGKPVKLTTSGQKVNLIPDPKTNALEFDIKDPVYNLELTVEPGITARLFVDIGLWGKSWDLPIFFPSLAISLPAGGVTFGCHEGTVCSRDFTFAPDPGKLAMQDLARWSNQFESAWLPQCRDAQCEGAIRFTRLGYEGLMKQKIDQLGANAGKLGQDPFFTAKFAEASAIAKKLKREGDLRRFSIEFEPKWAGQCADQKCIGAIKLIRTAAEIEFKKLMPPGVPVPAPTNGVVLEDFGWQTREADADKGAMQAVLDSLNTKIAGAKDQWIGSVKAPYDQQCYDVQCRYEVARLADEMGGKATALFKLSPELKKSGVVAEVTTRYTPKFKKAVADGLVRKNGPEIK